MNTGTERRESNSIGQLSSQNSAHIVIKQQREKGSTGDLYTISSLIIFHAHICCKEFIDNSITMSLELSIIACVGEGLNGRNPTP